MEKVYRLKSSISELFTYVRPAEGNVVCWVYKKCSQTIANQAKEKQANPTSILSDTNWGSKNTKCTARLSVASVSNGLALSTVENDVRVEPKSATRLGDPSIIPFEIFEKIGLPHQ